jgi:transposase
MISYATWQHIRHLSRDKGLTPAQIAVELAMDPKTVRRWLALERYEPRKPTLRRCKLDPFKPRILRMLETHPYSAAQILAEIRREGYSGGRSILQEFVARMRPRREEAFLSLRFLPGDCAQVDWGEAGSVPVGDTRRRLSFFVMVLGHSRMMYLEFTLSQQAEYFLACHRRAFEFFGGVPRRVMIDNLKSAVLSHPRGGVPEYHPRYLDLARHYGFEPRACNVRSPHEKGQVERAVGYVRDSLLNGLDLSAFPPLNPLARIWLEQTANVRVHGSMGKRPIDLFAEEKAAMQPLPANPYDPSVSSPVTASSQYRVTLDTNTYSVPAEYARRRLTLRRCPDFVRLYHENALIAEHARSHERRRDIVQPEHERELLQRKRGAREQQALARLLRLCPAAEAFVRGLNTRSLNPRSEILKTSALADLHGEDALRRALEDAVELEAFRSEYIANILQQRARPLPEAGPLHLLRNEDLLDLTLPPPDISIYR